MWIRSYYWLPETPTVSTSGDRGRFLPTSWVDFPLYRHLNAGGFVDA